MVPQGWPWQQLLRVVVATARRAAHEAALAAILGIQGVYGATSGAGLEGHSWAFEGELFVASPPYAFDNAH